MTLLFLGISSFLDDFLDSSSLFAYVKELCHLMVKLTVFICGVITLLLSDPVLLMEGVDSSSCFSKTFSIKVGG